MGSVNSQGKLSYRCIKCNKVHKLTCSDLTWQIAESQPKPLGPANIYVAAWKDPCECGAEMAFEFKVREYPINCLDGEDLKISGVEIIKYCNVGIKESLFLSNMKKDLIG